MIWNRLSTVSLQDRPCIRKLNTFLTRPYYVLLIGLLTLCSNLFALELPVYTVFILISCYIFIAGHDLLPFVPILVSCYITASIDNNPGRNNQSLFSAAGGGIYLLILVAVAVLFLILRLVTDKALGGKNFLSAKRTLLPGLLLLSAAYLMGGIGSPAPGGKHLVFALLQIAALVIPYYILAGGIKWKDCSYTYFSWIGLVMGFVLLAQIIWIYPANQVIVNNSIQKERIYTGWGIHNNIGGMLAMMIPFAFHLATFHDRHSWTCAIAATLFLFGVIMTCSRSAILTACAFWLICFIVMIAFTKYRRKNVLALIFLLSTGLIIALLSQDFLLILFKNMLAAGMDSNNRNFIYQAGLEQFSKYPIFGGSFFPIDYNLFDWSTVDSFSNFFPPRWHNTFVQILASTGLVGLSAYVFHRVQTVKLFWHKQTWEKTFIATSLLILLITSLLDCHFFNIGPTMFYSAALAFAEHCVYPKKRKVRKL